VIPSPMVKAETELRRAVERRQEGDISKYIAAYGEIAGTHVNSLLPGDPIRLQICERVLSVLKWARLTLLTRRASLAGDLLRLRKADRFLGAKLSAGPRFHLDL
jgi:hypothetical protein